MRSDCEVVIVGGGIAGASLAYFLGARGAGDVVVLEREAMPGCHATGRSAAVLYELDPIPALARLKVLGGRFLREPPDGFAEAPLLDPCGIVDAHTADGWAAAARAAAGHRALGVEVEEQTPAEVAARVPVVDPAAIAGALWVARDGHIDVHALLSGYLAGARRAGAEVRCGVEVTGVLIDDGRCAGVTTTAGEIRASRVVDAAGAWAGALAEIAGATPIALAPRRRCAAVFDPPGVDPTGWPLVCCDERRVYFEPESGGVLMSPMDEHPSAPCDARPDDETLAAGFARLAELAPPLVPRTVRRRWAGLRTFAPDRVPVVGDDPARPGFFWLAGQGGCGIETSPALGAIAADLILDGATDRFDAAALAPDRFR